MSEIKQHWQKIELNEILSISSKKFNPIGNNENKKCVELEHLSQETGKLLGYTNSSEQQSIKNSFEEGQILFGKLRPYLKKFWKAEFEGVCSSEIWVMNGKKVKNDFLFYLIQTEKFNQIANVSSGSKMPRADWNYMSEIPFDIPPLKEQEKIAEILTTWDEAITKQTELLRAKELQKKALMQKLLSGEVRFDGFSDKWEEVRLGEIGNSFNGLSGKTGEDFGIGEAKYITYKNIFNYSKIKLDIFENVQISNDEKQNLVQFGDIFFTVSSETPEEVGMSSVLLDNVSNTYLNSFCFGYRLNNFNTLDPYFARFYFRSFQMRDKISRLAQGSTRFNLSKNEIMKLKIKLPSLPEQQKIAEVLSLADDEINLLKNELEELKLQKKALMQKLLTGQVRVKV